MAAAARKELVNLYRSAIDAATKVQRNKSKIAFMSMTKANVYAFETYGDQLAAYQSEAAKARDLFAKAASGLHTAEIVSIIAEATQIEAAA